MRSRNKKQAKVEINNYPNHIFRTVDDAVRNLPNKAVIIEIGMGNGRFINRLAQENPQQTFLGVEVKEERCLQAYKKAKDSQITNLFFLCNNFISNQEEYKKLRAHTIWITFSDPWPKKRHHKRRLLHPSSLPTIHQMLQPQGQLIFKTDHQNLFTDTVTYLQQSNDFIITRIETDLETSDFYEKAKTEYELKYQAQGSTTKLVVASKITIN